MCCELLLGTVWESFSEISSHAAVPSQLAEPLWTDWPEEWNWCTEADLCCKKKLNKKLRLELVYLIFPHNPLMEGRSLHLVIRYELTGE